MQTFLPYFSFIESAKVLDNKRLGKQRVEALKNYIFLYLYINKLEKYNEKILWHYL